MKTWKRIYQWIRSTLFSAFQVVVGLYVALYLVISIPAVQRAIRDTAVSQLSDLLTTEVSIEKLDFSPFNQLELRGVRIPQPDGKPCINIEKIGAGISLWRLLSEGKIVITYAELIGLDAKINQPEEGAPLNIDFIIKALEPKDKTKPPTKFDLAIRNIVIRKCNISFDRLWKPVLPDTTLFDVNHLKLINLRTDLIINQLSNDNINVTLRRLAFTERCGLEVGKLAFEASYTPTVLTLKDFELLLPNSSITIGHFMQTYPSPADFLQMLRTTDHHFTFANWKLTPADFKCFYTPLETLTQPLFLSIDATGSIENLDIESANISMADEQLMLNAAGHMYRVTSQPAALLENLRLHVDQKYAARLLEIVPKISEKAKETIASLGDITLKTEGFYGDDKLEAEGDVSTSLGTLTFDAALTGLSTKNPALKGVVKSEELNLRPLLPQSGLGILAIDGEADLKFGGKYPEGTASISLPFVEFRDSELEAVTLDAAFDGSFADVSISASGASLSLDADATLALKGKDSEFSLDLQLENFLPGDFGLLYSFPGAQLHGTLNASTIGNTPDNILGSISISEAAISCSDGRALQLHSLTADAFEKADNERNIRVLSDFFDADISGFFTWKNLIASAKQLLASTLGSPSATAPQNENTRVAANVTLLPDNGLMEFLKAPIRILVPTSINASLDSQLGVAQLATSIPYLQQGKNKLVRNTYLNLAVDSRTGSALALSTLWPTAKGSVNLSLDATAFDGNADLDVNWDFNRKQAYRGSVNLAVAAQLSPETGKRDILTLEVKPSTFYVNDAEWLVEPAKLTYADNRIDVPRLRVWHKGQFVDISGTASPSADDFINVSLSDIDLGYIFDTLNINFVTFGGIATGQVKANQVLSPLPRAATDGLFVKDFSYNSERLGDADLQAAWQHEEKRVAIRADVIDVERNQGSVTEDEASQPSPSSKTSKTSKTYRSTIDGGVWVTRDSLGFNLRTDGVNVAFVQPFLNTFCSEMSGRASGDLTLYGTFKDVNLKGAIKTHDVNMKIAATNVTYSGSDSIIFKPGLIRIPSFKAADKYGNTGVLSGQIRHDYFRDAYIDLKVLKAKNILCFDTDARINPDWYGTIFASGNMQITGDPTQTSILVDVRTEPNSNFTFVLSNKEAAAEYNFLTFTDKRKEERERLMPKVKTEPDFVESFRKKIDTQQQSSSDFHIDIRGDITPDARVTLVMDPVAGDKITAYGKGNLQLGYDAESDDISLSGTYTLDRGTYNFSLQDLILKDFTIKPGSSITFSGDPMQAQLDITAAYRVNTNLADLDKSFSTGRELNRTNVPVEAILNVDGELTHPDITFDIGLPTLTSDIERKVRSIISTDDMMNRQIIYLLALNRFYTPEYMGGTGNGGEFSSLASGTISSQIQSALGQLTDKFAIAPSFRTDKGDFSDLEMDLALSSSLLNNRLLINGNFGYRDRATSSTTFVGDFDIEYLLTRKGNLRMKAYNHYNDQNYYLKSALTTQGIGLLYRLDFDRWFNRHTPAPKDSISPASRSEDNQN